MRVFFNKYIICYLFIKELSKAKTFSGLSNIRRRSRPKATYEVISKSMLQEKNVRNVQLYFVEVVLFLLKGAGKHLVLSDNLEF